MAQAPFADMEIPEINIQELETRIAEGAKVLDVREMDEYETTRIQNVIHIPIEELPARYEELAKETNYCVVCAKGGRSAKAVEFLVGNGYKATNVAGGTDAWVEAGKPYDAG